MDRLLKIIIKLQKGIKFYLFEEKIKRKGVLFERKHGREMDDIEINQYKFRLFTFYSLIIIVPVLAAISFM